MAFHLVCLLLLGLQLLNYRAILQTGSSDFTDTMTFTDGIVYDSSELITTDSVNNYNIDSFIDKISNIAQDYGLVLEKQGRNTYKPTKQRKINLLPAHSIQILTQFGAISHPRKSNPTQR